MMVLRVRVQQPTARAGRLASRPETPPSVGNRVKPPPAAIPVRRAVSCRSMESAISAPAGVGRTPPQRDQRASSLAGPSGRAKAYPQPMAATSAPASQMKASRRRRSRVQRRPVPAMGSRESTTAPATQPSAKASISTAPQTRRRCSPVADVVVARIRNAPTDTHAPKRAIVMSSLRSAPTPR